MLETELSPCGEKEYTEVFDGINYQDFTINIVDCGNEAWECSVMRRLVSAVQKHTVSKGSDKGIVLWTLVDWLNVMLSRVSTWPRLW